MSRVKRGVHARKKRRATLERTKGYRGRAHSTYKAAKEAETKAGVYAYRDRRNKKRDFRRLWITRIMPSAPGRRQLPDPSGNCQTRPGAPSEAPLFCSKP
jgi:ribosomal protein L20